MFKNPELRTAFSASGDTASALDIFHLEEEPTKRLMDFCEKYHVSLACLLLMGLRTYFQKMNGHDDVSINNAQREEIRRNKDPLLPGKDGLPGEHEVHRRCVCDPR